MKIHLDIDHYVVRDGREVNRVNREGVCTCGKENCPHVKAVRDYFRSGGSQLPKPQPIYRVVAHEFKNDRIVPFLQYLVYDEEEKRHYKVRDGVCECGQKLCGHLAKVSDHIFDHGEEPPPKPEFDGICPICGGATEKFGRMWRCKDGGNAHYWRTRTDLREAMQSGSIPYDEEFLRNCHDTMLELYRKYNGSPVYQ